MRRLVFLILVRIRVKTVLYLCWLPHARKLSGPTTTLNVYSVLLGVVRAFDLNDSLSRQVLQCRQGVEAAYWTRNATFFVLLFCCACSTTRTACAILSLAVFGMLCFPPYALEWL